LHVDKTNFAFEYDKQNTRKCLVNVGSKYTGLWV